MGGRRKHQKIDDRYLSALWDFREDEDGVIKAHIIWDSTVPGLQVRIGKNRVTWTFQREHREHGKRGTTCKVLGHWPVMNTTTARKEALIEAGKVAAGRIEPGKRQAVRFESAFTDYLGHLERKAAKAGKPPRWHRNVVAMGKQLLLPKWGQWSLTEMSKLPGAVAEWHRKVTKENGATTANHCARLIRAVYRRAARLDRTLPPHNPVSAVEFNSETIGGQGVAFKDFPAWAEACRRIENPIHRAYHLFCLLTGTRPGEAARIRWQDVRPRERAVIISAAKAGNDIRIPMSGAIVRVLKMARDARGGGELVFPECAQRGRHDKLPARGVELRRTYRTIAADVGVDEMLTHFLMGHAPAGISQRYVARMILSSGKALRDAQRRISKRMIGLLGIDKLKLRPLEPWE